MKYFCLMVAIWISGCSTGGRETEVTEQKGTMGAGSAIELEALYYPNSRDTQQSSVQSDSEGNQTTVSVRETNDNPEQIRKFFDSKLGKAKNEVEMETGFTANWEKGENRYMVSVTQISGICTIVLTKSKK